MLQDDLLSWDQIYEIIYDLSFNLIPVIFVFTSFFSIFFKSINQIWDLMVLSKRWKVALSTGYDHITVIHFEEEKKVIKAAFMLILRRQNQRFETLIQNADPKRR